MPLQFTENRSPGARLNFNANARSRMASIVSIDWDYVTDTPFPLSSTDNAIVRWDGVAGREIQNSGVTISDADVVSGAKVLPTGAATARTLEARFADVLNVKDYGALGDGITNDTAAFQAAYNAAAPASSIGGNVIYVPAGNYLLNSTVTGYSNIILRGAAGTPGPGVNGGTRLFRPSGNTTPMFTFPGNATTASGGDGTGWGFEGIVLDGNDANAPIVYAPEVVGGRGSWSASFNRVGLYRGRPAIHAVNGWDWLITDCAFVACGNAATGSGAETAAIYMLNSVSSSLELCCNSWRIDNNLIMTTTGIGILSAHTGATLGVNQFHFITNNHFGPPSGYSSITGTLRSCQISGNQIEGTDTGRITIDITSVSGVGYNRIINNFFGTVGTFNIRVAGAFELIAENTFLDVGSGGAHISLAATAGRCTVFGNKTDDSDATAIVLDAGSNNTIFDNDGSDGVVANGAMPLKRVGTTYYQPMLSGSAGMLAWNGTSTVAKRTITAPAAGISVANGDGASGNPTLSLANDLAALEGLASTGLAARTASDTWAERTLTAPAAGFTITNPAGIAGNPTFVLGNDLSALEGLGSTGIAVRTASDTWAQRAVTGTANEITATNGDGVSGNPTLSLPTAMTFTGKTVTGGTFASPTLNTPDIDSDAFVGMKLRGFGTPSAYQVAFYTAAGALQWGMDGSGHFVPNSTSNTIGRSDSRWGSANVNYVDLADGISAPGATVGSAKIYVDTADGDLKVIFGDGTIKTLATDT